MTTQETINLAALLMGSGGIVGLTVLIYRIGRIVERFERYEQDVNWVKGLFDHLAKERILALLGEKKLKKNSPLGVDPDVRLPRTIADRLDKVRPVVLNGYADLEEAGYFNIMTKLARYFTPEDVVLVRTVSGARDIADARVYMMAYLEGGGGTLVDPQPLPEAT